MSETGNKERDAFGIIDFDVKVKESERSPDNPYESDGIKVDDLIAYLEKHRGKIITTNEDTGRDFLAFIEVYPTRTGRNAGRELTFCVMNEEYFFEGEGRNTEIFDGYANSARLKELWNQKIDEEIKEGYREDDSDE